MLLSCLEKMMDGYFALVPRPTPQREELALVRVIAHRGAHNATLGLVENTLAAFRHAEKAGCWGIEFDVRATADDVLVVHHDPCLRRLWKQKAAIADLSLTQLRLLAPEIPTLAEVLSEFGGRLHLFIELKEPFHHEDILALALRGLSAEKDYHLLTLNAAIFKSLVQFPPQALLLVAGHNNVGQFCDLSLQAPYGGLLGHYLLLNNTAVQRLKNAKQKLGVGFVDSKYSLYRELNRGICWIFTNNAPAVTSCLNSLIEQKTP